MQLLKISNEPIRNLVEPQGTEYQVKDQKRGKRKTWRRVILTTRYAAGFALRVLISYLVNLEKITIVIFDERWLHVLKKLWTLLPICMLGILWSVRTIKKDDGKNIVTKMFSFYFCGQFCKLQTILTRGSKDPLAIISIQNSSKAIKIFWFLLSFNSNFQKRCSNFQKVNKKTFLISPGSNHGW